MILRLPLLLIILGPTASGKTALSLALAEQFSGEIVSCDSVAVFREFEIGTAKPSPQERSRARHHLIDVFGPAEFCTAGDYARMARQALKEIDARKHLPIVVGGTGLYLRALIDGLFVGPQRSEELRERLRARGDERGSPYLYKMLSRLDPQAAQSIHPNDAAKLLRAIEVCLTARGPMTELWRQGRDPLDGFRILRIGLSPDRSALYDRINRRALQMFENGLVEETRGLLQRYGNNARALESLGYRQAVQYLSGEISLDQAMTLVQQGHRNYAKRQMTWFRREPDVHWITAFGDQPDAQTQITELVRKSL